MDVVYFVLGFLSFGGGRADQQLEEYITHALRMKKKIFSEKVGSGSSLHYMTLNVYIDLQFMSSRLENSAHWATPSLLGRHFP